jgi:hypothetical protein
MCPCVYLSACVYVCVCECVYRFVRPCLCAIARAYNYVLCFMRGAFDGPAYLKANQAWACALRFPAPKQVSIVFK